jgi:hypothetical protein
MAVAVPGSAYIRANEIEVKRTTIQTTIPSNDVARLMYYLYCVCTTVNYTDDATIQRFISYQNWRDLGRDDQKALVNFCEKIKPSDLNGKVFFQNDDLCIEFPNEFYEINQVQKRFLLLDKHVKLTK